MMPARFVVDNSVVMAWCFADEENAYADAVLKNLETCEAVVPAVWPLEVGNALVVAERKKRLAEADVIRFLSIVADLPIVVEREGPERMLKEIVALARDTGLSTYDASYLDLAMRLGLPIATQDALLSQAAKKCRVRAFAPTRFPGK